MPSSVAARLADPLAIGASLTGVTVRLAVATVLALAGAGLPSSVATKSKLVLPFQWAFGMKYSVSELATAEMAVPAPATFVRAASRYSVPLAGSVCSVKLATAPSISLAPSVSVSSVSSAPLALAAAATGASLTAPTLMVRVAAPLTPPLPSASTTLSVRGSVDGLSETLA